MTNCSYMTVWVTFPTNEIQLLPYAEENYGDTFPIDEYHLKKVVGFYNPIKMSIYPFVSKKVLNGVEL